MSTAKPISPYLLAFGADAAYAMPMAVALDSALNCLDSDLPITVLILDGGIEPSQRARLERVVHRYPAVDLIWRSTSTGSFHEFNVTPWGAPSNYLRLLIPEAAPAACRAAIYLDSDTLTRADLSPLFIKAESSDALLHAVHDYHHANAQSVWGPTACDDLEVNPTAPYFNSGVLAFNPAIWRRSRVPQRSMEVAKRHKAHFRYSDQDALNVVLTDAWQSLHESWNVALSVASGYFKAGRSSLSSESEMINEARILHYTGRRKPWRPGYLGPASDDFLAALFRSDWFESETERRLWRLRLKATPDSTRIKVAAARRFPGLYRRLRKTQS